MDTKKTTAEAVTNENTLSQREVRAAKLGHEWAENPAHKNKQLAWHYTIGENATKILDSGWIRPTTLYVPETEIPVVWFSIAKGWEPTATPMIKGVGVQRSATMEETRQMGGGLVRFGLPKSALLPWRRLKSAANFDPEAVRRLGKAAKDMGANPAHWYGLLEPVAVRDCILQFEHSPGEWEEPSYETD